MSRVILSSIFASLLALPSAAQDAGKVKLEWKFKKGDTHRYEVSTTYEIEIRGIGLSEETLLGLSMEVSEVTAEGTAVLQATIDRVLMKMTFRKDTVDYDSDRDKFVEDGAGRVLSALLDKTLTIHLTRRGECLKVDGVDGLLEAVEKRFPAGLLKGMAATLRKSVSDDRAKGLMQMSLGCLPADPVGPGETWDGSASVSMGILGKADMKTKAALKELRAKGAEAVIDVETKVGLKVGEGGWPLPSLELLEGKMKSEMVWLVDRGLMQSSKGEMKFELSLAPNSPLISAGIKQEMKLAPRAKKPPAKEGK